MDGASSLDGAPSGPKFSVVVPTFNGNRQAVETLKAVLGQRFDDFELVVVDDGSTDDSARQVRDLADPRLRLIRQQHMGPSSARNVGARDSRGEYLVFLDDDDRPLPEWLSALAAETEQARPQVVFMASKDVDESGRVLRVDAVGAMGARFPGFVGKERLPLCVSRELFLRIGGYADALKYGENTELLLRLLREVRPTDTRAVGRPLVLIRDRGAPAMMVYRTSDILEGAEFVLDRHGDRLDVGTLVDYHSVAGVAAYRLGRTNQAREHFLSAWRLDYSARTFGRMCVLAIPFLARRVWGLQ